jgi:hypothetical protein
MPAQQCLGLNQPKHGSPSRRHTSERDKRDAIQRRQLRPIDVSPYYGKLVTKQCIFSEQRPARPECVQQRS